MKTKKIILSSLVILFITLWNTPVFSQVKFGIKAEVGLNNPDFNSDALEVSNLTSYSIGPSIEALFPASAIDFGIEASLLYNDNRMTVSKLTGTRSEHDVTNRYLNLPVNVKLKIGFEGLPLKIYGVGGPYAGYLISGDTVDLEQIGDDIKAKSFQAGINIGGGIELMGMIQLGLNYQVQLTDNYALDQPNWGDPLNGKTNSWSITGAIYF